MQPLGDFPRQGDGYSRDPDGSGGDRPGKEDRLRLILDQMFA